MLIVATGLLLLLLLLRSWGGTVEFVCCVSGKHIFTSNRPRGTILSERAAISTQAASPSRCTEHSVPEFSLVIILVGQVSARRGLHTAVTSSPGMIGLNTG